ncbi:MAG: GSU2403 family nucleotidyltransferase fold protein [Desulfobacteraceae bacterium]|jgi:hypothetical protein
MPEKFKAGFLKTLWVLRDYLSFIVIGGGWVPLLYYHYLLADKSKEPLRTRDIDLLVNVKIPVIRGKTMDQLLQEAGFEQKFKSADTPPVVHYEGIIDDVEVEVEFLTDQTGAKDDVAIEVQKGLHAEALRFASVAISNVIEVMIDDFWIEEELRELKVKVPSPEAYIFHKGLTFVRRKDDQKKAKDLYYVFDILANCPQLRERIITGLREFKEAYPTWFLRFNKNLKDNFSDITSDGIAMVLSQRPDGVFPELNEDQFKQYVFGIFQELLSDLNSRRK